MSSTRQLRLLARGRSRNSSADANVSGFQPAKSRRSSSDSRTDTSSSTTKTNGLSDCVADDGAETINFKALLDLRFVVLVPVENQFLFITALAKLSFFESNVVDHDRAV